MSDPEHIHNAQKILASLGLPRAQQNERSALSPTGPSRPYAREEMDSS